MKANLRERLKSPLALVAQGFAAGGLLLLAIDPLAPTGPAPAPTGGVAIVADPAA